MNASHPLSHLQDAEAALIASIDRAAEAVGNVGTSGLDAALARLHSATQAAAERLDRASQIVRALAGDVLVAAGAVAREIDEAVTANSPPPPIRRDEPTPEAELTIGHVEHDADGERHGNPSSVPHWLRNGIVGAIAEASADEPSVSRVEDRAGRDRASGTPDVRTASGDAAGERAAHPPGRNGKTPNKRR